MRFTLLIIGLALFVFASGFASAGECPAGAKDCFLCGGVGGIPCTTNCTGVFREGVGNVVCECPQGEPCVCHCPVEGGGAVAGAGEGGVPESSFGRLTGYTGDVYVKSPGGEWARVSSSVPLSENTVLKSGKNSKATILLDDGSKIYMDEETELGMQELKRPESRGTLDVVIELVKGAIFSDVTKREGTRFEVNAGGVSVPGVKGTKFAVYCDDAAGVAIIKAVEGTVAVPDRFGRSIDLEGGKMVRVTRESGLGEVEGFDAGAEEGKWGAAGGGCGAAFLLPLILCSALLVRRGGAED